MRVLDLRSFHLPSSSAGIIVVNRICHSGDSPSPLMVCLPAASYNNHLRFHWADPPFILGLSWAFDPIQTPG
jgi:hypothetical protein